MNIYRNIMALVMLLMLPIPMIGLTYNQKIAYTLTASLIGSYMGYLWLRTPEKFTPTLTSINPVTLSPTDKCPPAPTTLLEDISDFMDRLPWRKKKKEKAPVIHVILSESKSCTRKASPAIDLTEISTGEPVTVFSPFCSKKTIKRKNKIYVTGSPGRGTYTASRYIANGAIPQKATCVTFDYRDARAGFTFGQEKDQQSLKFVIDEVIRQQHPMVLFGACRGALNILNFITSQPTDYLATNIKAVIVEAPPFSLKEVCKQHVRSYVPYYFPTDTLSAALYGLYRTVLPAYKDSDATCVHNVTNIPADLPILIIHLNNDHYVSNENIKELLQKLVDTGHTNVHALIINDPTLTHATISTAPSYSRAIHAFLKKYDLPYDAPLAEDGEHIQSSFLTPLTTTNSIDTLFTEQAITANGWSTAG